MSKLSHYDEAGQARMVDVSGKAVTQRTARAQAFVRMPKAVVAELRRNPKGDPLEVARVAGILAAKQTGTLIPMCHPLPLSAVNIDLTVTATGIRVETVASTTGVTGVEMEAMTAAAVAALTIYDMTKGLDKGIEIQELYLLEKTGGKSGHWKRPAAKPTKPEPKR